MADGFELNPAGVRDFGTQLRAAVDRDVVPAADRIRGYLTWYPSFGGRSGSPAVQTAALRYNTELNAALTFLDTLIHNAHTLAEAAELVVQTYQRGDELSVADMQAVLGRASAAATNAETARLMADQAAAQADAEFRRQHGGAQ
ncbi:hypothetical protein KZZ52_05265 [Dactylosporangium sp. AC04546]|uniref:hypothetical protein n=1 Tax=Dactylosporangium sp. AC04546 TaxID=2862460 RepID=UPI001EDCB2FF|nr:hypothetical protein [Dactylosporangium sp. AC04546]WVK84823.1 hypothetical protein KZZ52_05265 [Dactylosporangium sp. AC04546]